MRDLHTSPETFWKILCNSFQCFSLHNYIANSAIILFLRFLVVEKLGQCDLYKKKFKKKKFKLLINHLTDFNEIQVIRYSSKKGFLSCKSFGFDLFSVNCANRCMDKVQI